MKEIRLTQGQLTMVDDEDFEGLNRHKWCASYNSNTKSYYAVRHIRGENGKSRTVCLAREILDCPKSRQVDHVNHDTLDNRKCNLSLVSHRQNHQNRKDQTAVSSVYPGVHKTRNKWRARIQIGGKCMHLGFFDNERTAFEAYCAALTHIGESLYRPERFE